MKKLLILFLSLLSCNALQAQDPKITAEGDLNKDGVADKVVYIPKLFGEDNFAIYFGDGHGDYSLFRSYDLGLYSDTQISINEKGVMRIQEGEAGSCDVFLFRYQEGDFRCIGGKMDRHDFYHYDVSYNFLTGKQIRIDGEGKDKDSSTSKMPPMPVLRLGWFPLDFEVLGYLFDDYEGEDAMEYKTVMGIYGMMQEQGMVSPSFVMIHELSGSAENGWSSYNEIMKYGCFNLSTDISIAKQDDGSYRIHLMNSYEDRTYEQYLDEDGENLEEAMERADAERGGEPSSSYGEEDWLFKDGKFTKISSETKEE